MTFSEIDKKAIAERGSNLETVQQQIAYFEKGFPSLQLVKPAVIGDGMITLSDQELKEHVDNFETVNLNHKIVKFVPASGAASRMFKELFSFMESYKGTEEEYQKMIGNTGSQSVFAFFKNIEKFAFYDDLDAAYNSETGESLAEGVIKRDYVTILQVFLTVSGLDYGNLPKGLLKFHRYSETENRTPVEEHLVEGAYYAKDNKGKVSLHFTVSPEHLPKFKEHIETVKAKYEVSYGVKYDISFSEQKKSTDTIAVDMNNKPFRDGDELLFRPAGHGALIENLNDLDADITFIKNIDNVVPDNIRDTTYQYKKAIYGVLVAYQHKVNHYLRMLDKDTNEQILAEMTQFVEKDLCMQLHMTAGMSNAEKARILSEKLNRPMRVCGMVKNEGEPGGGPFWAVNPDNSVSLQVVETAQIDLNKADQKTILDQSSHFNPVDLVCSLKSYKGDKFDLSEYTDPMTGFITKKSKDGRDLKAQELPGLWNGAMANWITIFVEVPVITFNPVKTVNDLLKKEHQ
jgi:hypothetical protein